jgi:CRP-like cAMP-binding protein
MTATASKPFTQVALERPLRPSAVHRPDPAPAGTQRLNGGELDTVNLFTNLPSSALRRLEAVATSREPRDGALIFGQGDPADAVYAITGGDGHVRIRAANGGSKQLMVNVFKAGEIFGEVGVLDGGPRTAEALAEGRLRISRIPAAAFLLVLDETPELGRSLSRLLASRIRRTSTLLRDAVFEPLGARLARQVLYLADLNGWRTEQGIRLAGRFRQADLADLLGTTPRSIITILNHWRERGLVTYDALRGQLTVRHEEGLRALVMPEDTP